MTISANDDSDAVIKFKSGNEKLVELALLKNTGSFVIK